MLVKSLLSIRTGIVIQLLQKQPFDEPEKDNPCVLHDDDFGQSERPGTLHALVCQQP